MEIARRAGATVRRDGSEAEAYLQLSPAGRATHMAELMTLHYGEANYQIKKQARQFWKFLSGVQEVRQGVRSGRHRAAE